MSGDVDPLPLWIQFSTDWGEIGSTLIFFFYSLWRIFRLQRNGSCVPSTVWFVNQIFGYNIRWYSKNDKIISIYSYAKVWAQIERQTKTQYSVTYWLICIINNKQDVFFHYSIWLLFNYLVLFGFVYFFLTPIQI